MFLDRHFDLTRRQTSVAAEARGALATFLTMAYILVANGAILSQAGIPFASAVACTALAAGICCLMMGWFGNFPLAMASGMGLNTFVAFQLTAATGSWQKAMGLIVLDGLFVLVLVIAGLREAVMRAIPRALKLAIGSGIGLFIAFIGLVNAKLVVVPPGTLAVLAKNPSAVMPPVTFGSFHAPETWVATLGLFVTAFLLARQSKGAFVWGIFLSTILSLAVGLTHLPKSWSAPDFQIAFQADIGGALKLAFLPLLLSLVMVDFFDTLGTVTAIAEQAQLVDRHGNIPRLRKILLLDAVSACIGGLLGASSVTAYVESAAGVAEGARTGLSTIFVGLLFLGAVFLAPLASVVPTAATSPALILVGFLMTAQLRFIDFDDLPSAIPAFLIAIAIPLTFSIAHGIGLGFISYTAIKLLAGRYREVHPLMYAISGIFALQLIFA
jgi:AGZA family xanthine/uracil permease-like MFS transporter